ncbi:MAG: type V CRISPR-associated protein Cas12a/Cpf1, partial [Clostridia bacterium]|nr:type V CRISPR-associated protein Cas12a/Cpf1 [Clostridia bacterium]
IEKLFANTEYDLDKIIVPVKKLTEYSQACTGRWNAVGEAVRQNFIAQHGEPKKKKDEDTLDKELKKDQSLQDLKTILASAPSMEEINIVDYLNNDNLVKQTFSGIELEVKNLDEGFGTLIQKISYKDGSDLKQKDDDVEHIKNYLDCALNLYHYLELVDYRGEAEKDGDFYSTYEKVIERLSGILFLYNKVRNYVTKKIDTEKKFKLNFDSPTLANGWDANKESANNAIILRKNGKYYLGIFNPNDKPKIDNEVICDASECYEKMVYKLLPGPNKMLPKVFFSKKGLETFNPPKEILEGYAKESYKKGDAFDIVFCRKLIDWFKEAINQHPDWKKFNFKFSKTESYADISEFYREITEQGYKISFIKIAESEIQNLVDCGKLFLFQIYNKDYAENSCGSKNLHTLYWENLFSEENLKDAVLKLNGEAELFFRPQVIKEDKIITHKKDSYLVNRIGKNGKRIPESFYQEIYKKANGMTDQISDEAKEFEKNAVVKKATHDIVKDRRFTQNVYQFHCPITMNFKAAELTGKKFNERVQELLAKDPSVKVIGIDRGERHLLYLSLIN